MCPTATAAAVELPTAAGPEQLGGKGNTLNLLSRLGAPVPRCAVVTSDLYRAVLAEDESLVAFLRTLGPQPADPEREIGEIDQAFLAATVPDDAMASAVRMGLDIAAGGALAVRSSATLEDSAEASFAGQYRSYLNVEGSAAIERCIRLTWASLWYPAPRAYRNHLGIGDFEQAMAVILMRQIAASEAGVVFTEDPLGESDSLRIESVRGLADRFVSGHETPTALHVPRAGELDDKRAHLTELRDWALRIESALGTPADIEWAFDGAALFIVQARPQTALTGDGFDTRPDPGAQLTAGGIAEMLPGVVPPLLWEFNSYLLEEALRSLLSRTAGLPATMSTAHDFIHRRSGRAYLNTSAMQAAGLALPDDQTRSFDALYTVQAARPSRTHRHSFNRDWQAARLRHSARFEAAVLHTAISELVATSTPIDHYDDEQLLHYLARLIDLGARTAAAEAAVAATAAAAFERLLRRLSKYTDYEVALGLAQRLTANVEARGDQPVSAGASAALFGGPTWRGLGLAPPRRADRKTPSSSAPEIQTLRRTRTWRRQRVMGGVVIDLPQALLDHAVADATKWLAWRERTKTDLLRLGGEVRRCTLEAGQRLMTRAVLMDPAEVDLLAVRELHAALRNATPPKQLSRRRAALTNYASTVDAEGAGPRPADTSWTGWGASAGHFTGAARMVTAASGDGLEEGEVLVAHTTDSSWTPLFLRAGAIVVEQGGPLSHAAILARELGRPAVVNVTGVCAAVAAHPRCLLAVDGATGRIDLIEPEQSEQS